MPNRHRERANARSSGGLRRVSGATRGLPPVAEARHALRGRSYQASARQRTLPRRALQRFRNRCLGCEGQNAAADTDFGNRLAQAYRRANRARTQRRTARRCQCGRGQPQRCVANVGVQLVFFMALRSLVGQRRQSSGPSLPASSSEDAHPGIPPNRAAGVAARGSRAVSGPCPRTEVSLAPAGSPSTWAAHMAAAALGRDGPIDSWRHRCGAAVLYGAYRSQRDQPQRSLAAVVATPAFRRRPLDC